LNEGPYEAKVAPIPAAVEAGSKLVASAVRRMDRRLAPSLMLMYIVSFLDRSNVGFAKDALHASAGITEAMYALGAGMFFVGYATCGFPSNLILHRVGAKIWLSLMMVAWGLVSMSTMLVKGPTSFYLLRAFLGAMEAGFFPGCILYLTYWYPNRVRGQVLGFFYLGVPLSLVLGGPLSGLLLEIRHFAGLDGWQWMFLVEGFLAVVSGFIAYGLLDDKPANARWLPKDEKQALVAALEREEAERRSSGPTELLPMLRDPHVLRFVLMYGLIQMSVYAAIFYLPSQISTLLHRPAGLLVGLVTAIPWACATVTCYWLTRAADRWQNHQKLAALTLLAGGLASLAFPTCGAVMGVLMLSVAVSALVVVQPLFWTLPTGYLADRAKAGGIALVGTGNIGGFISPNVKVWADMCFRSPRAGLYVLAVITVLNSGLIATTRKRKQMLAGD